MLPACYWLRQCREFSQNPDPRRYTLSQCCFIWLYVSSLATEWEMGFPLVIEDDWLTLTEYLDNNYPLLSPEMQDAISHDILIWRTPWGVDWSQGKPMVIDKLVATYVKIIEGGKKGNVEQAV